MNELIDLVDMYLREVAVTVDEVVKQGTGGEVLGAVPGRPESEDVQIRIDEICDQLYQDVITNSGLPISVNSEHGLYGSDRPQYLSAIDPFDGSGLFRTGLRKEWYSVLTIFDLDGAPIVGGALDIRSREMYIAAEGSVTLISLRDDSRVEVHRSDKTVPDSDTVLAAYTMNRDYRRDWLRKAHRLNDSFPGLLWGNGGACIYHLIAAGEVHAYLMFDEPRSEIDPGLGFAAAAGFPAYSVTADGTLNPYRFDPNTHLEGRVPIFITSCTQELAENIVREIIQR